MLATQENIARAGAVIALMVATSVATAAIIRRAPDLVVGCAAQDADAANAEAANAAPPPVVAAAAAPDPAASLLVAPEPPPRTGGSTVIVEPPREPDLLEAFQARQDQETRDTALVAAAREGAEEGAREAALETEDRRVATSP